MRTIIIALATAFSTASCTNDVSRTLELVSQPLSERVAAYTGPTRKLNAAEKKLIGNIVARGLKDPGSVQFRWAPVPATFPDGPQKYCATVNGKNSYGGYVGFKAYQVDLDIKRNAVVGAKLVGMDGGWEFGEIGITDRCERAGLDPSKEE